jgi:hypothetical protein
LKCVQPELFKVSKCLRYNDDDGKLPYIDCTLSTTSTGHPIAHDSNYNLNFSVKHDDDDDDEDDDDYNANNDRDVNGVDGALTSTPLTGCLDFSLSHGVLTTPAPPQASLIEYYLLHHYTFKLSTVLINVDSPSNPLRGVILPRAVTSPMLMNALYATSALHVFTGNRDPKLGTLALTYYDKAVSTLQHSLATWDLQRERTELEVLLLTVVCLCKYEILSGGGSNWRSHLQGLQKLLQTGISPAALSKLAPETVSYIQSL